MADNNGFAAGLDRLDENFDQTGNMAAAFEAELSRLRQSMMFTSREVSTLSSGLERGLRGAFEGVVFDGMKLSDALRGLARSISETIFSIAMKPVEQALAGSIAQGLGGIVAGAMPFADGGAFLQGRVMTFAKGGVVSQPTYFPMRGATGLMGEAGPEAIMPLRRGADGRLGVAAAAGGSGRAINVTMNVTTPDVAGFRRSQSQVAAQLGRALARGDRNI